MSAILVSTVAARSLDETSKLVGVWQNSEGVGSGLTDQYQFYDDGTFVYNFNQMDGTKRLVSHSGFWNLHRGMLHLHTTAMAVHLGGKWVKASGSTATEYEIEGGEIFKVRLKRALKRSLKLTGPKKDDMYTVITIDGEKFWQLSTDPRAYDIEH